MIIVIIITREGEGTPQFTAAGQGSEKYRCIPTYIVREIVHKHVKSQNTSQQARGINR